MRTKLYRSADLNAILRSVDPSCIPTEESLRGYVRNELTRGCAFYTSCAAEEPIRHGDKATIRVSSALAKFNREKVPVSVGTGLYYADLEAALIGLKAGESGTITVKGETVSFTVLGVEQPCRPDPTDEMVLAQDIEGVTTVAQFSAYVLKQKREEYLKTLVEQLLDQMILQSDFSAIDPQDVKEATDLRYTVMRERFLHSGTDLDALTSEEWSQTIYAPKVFVYMEKYNQEMGKLAAAPNKQAYYELLRPEVERSIQYSLVLCAVLLKTDTEAYDPTKQLHADKPLIEEFIRMVQAQLFVKG
ncbi:MAG TPA: hypothetical protein VHP31_05490 [Caproicibacter sp.]|nr:hypothetical protein [Caproicibacter sp.]